MKAKGGIGILLLVVLFGLAMAKKVEAAPPPTELPPTEPPTEPPAELPPAELAEEKVAAPTKVSEPELKELEVFRKQYWETQMEQPEAIQFPITEMALTEEVVHFTGGAYPVSYEAGSVGYEGTIHQLQSLEQGGIYRSELWWMQQEALAQAGKPQALYLALRGESPPPSEAEAAAIEAAGAAAYAEAGGYGEEYFRAMGLIP